MKKLNSIFMAGKEVLPLVEGGKGVAVSNGLTAGSWAASGGIGMIKGGVLNGGPLLGSLPTSLI